MVPKPVEGWWSVAHAPDSSQIALAEVGDSTQIRRGPAHHWNHYHIMISWLGFVIVQLSDTMWRQSANLADMLLGPLFPLSNPHCSTSFVVPPLPFKIYNLTLLFQ